MQEITYTRKIDREYNKLLMKGATTKTDMMGKPEISLDLSNMQDANDYLVMTLFWLKQKEVDDMTVDEYNTKLEEANKMRSPL